MTKITKFLAVAFFVCSFSLCAFAQNVRQLRIPNGVGTVNFKGTVEKTRKTYVLTIRPGQKARFTVTSSNVKVVFDAYYFPPNEEFGTPLVSETREWAGTLPAAVKYSVDVYSKDQTRGTYKFTVKIE
jgi:hypothetical protein